jgi:hypothetical protein
VLQAEQTVSADWVEQCRDSLWLGFDKLMAWVLNNFRSPQEKIALFRPDLQLVGVVERDGWFPIHMMPINIDQVQEEADRTIVLEPG